MSKDEISDDFLQDFMDSIIKDEDKEDITIDRSNKKEYKNHIDVEEDKHHDEGVFENSYTQDNVSDEENEYNEEGIVYSDNESEQGEQDDYEHEYDTLERLDQEESGLSAAALAILNWEPEPPLSIGDTIVNEWITTGWIGLTHVDQILTEAIITGASDVHLTANQRVSMSRNGVIIRYDGYSIPDGDTMHQVIHDGMLSHQEQAVINSELEYDGAYTLQYGPYAGRRTRINIGRSFGEYAIVFRIISEYIPTLEELGVEDEIIEWSSFPNGLFLLCGPTGTGKSTTLASVVHNIQLTGQKKIVTIEKPIEYIYPDDTHSLVVQREVGEDTRGFYEGLTSAMRQNPDVILLGEVRNTEEVTELLRAAETGHLAISTMHTNSVATTINRIQNLFSGNEQKRIMSTLADTLRGIGNQVLIKDEDGGRFAVRELLSINQEIKELIINGDVQGIRRYQIERGATMEQKLAEAVSAGRCLESEALKQVVDRELFQSALKKA